MSVENEGHVADVKQLQLVQKRNAHWERADKGVMRQWDGEEGVLGVGDWIPGANVFTSLGISYVILKRKGMNSTKTKPKLTFNDC